jgi:hypothetical protein
LHSCAITTQQQQQHNNNSNNMQTQQEMWEMQEARTRTLVMRALVAAKAAAMQQLAQTKAQLAKGINAQALQLLDFEAVAAQHALNYLFAQAVEKLADTVAEVLESAEMRN